MSTTAPTPPTAELLDDDDNRPLTLDALARACQMDAGWVTARLQEGLLQVGTEGSDSPSAWRFSGATVVRARRMAHLEVAFDADPHLAALAADLMEEVAALRRQLRHLQAY